MRRHPAGPILTREDVPEVAGIVVDPSSVFNPGAIRTGSRTELLLRVQTRGRETVLLPAASEDGLRFLVEPRITTIHGLPDGVHHVYDPRLTRLDGRIHVVFAADTDDGCRIGISVGEDLLRQELIALLPGDARNGVLFPERVGGRYLMLARPNVRPLAGGPRSGDAVVLMESDDLGTWREVGEVMRGRPRSWDELVGAGPPPVKTAEGWLLLYHGVATHFGSVNIYQAGAGLLDLDRPDRVIARTRRNILEPREPWELVGQVPNVVFPTGVVLEPDPGPGEIAPRNAKVHVYYGAADTVVGLAVSTVGELLDACTDD